MAKQIGRPPRPLTLSQLHERLQKLEGKLATMGGATDMPLPEFRRRSLHLQGKLIKILSRFPRP